MEGKLTRGSKLSKVTYGFFLGPSCKALEPARFLLGGVEGSSCVIEVDILKGE